MKKPVVLTILDGFGLSPEFDNNAIAIANTPNIDRIFGSNPFTSLSASGMDVGLPDGQMGNSEVGHMNIGAGRIVYQDLTRITKSIQDKSFFENKVLVSAMKNCLENNSSLHIMGLLSDGGVHSHNTHLYALVRLAKDLGLKDVFIHCMMDGRDVSPTSGRSFVLELEEKLSETGVGKIATVMGRYYGMDRDCQWERVQKAYEAMTLSKGVRAARAVEILDSSYEKGVTDEFVIPAVTADAKPVKPNDTVIFFNFRPDRAREITRAFVDEEFDGFARESGFPGVKFVTMTEYDALMPNVEVAFEPVNQTINNLGEYISSLGLKQLRIAETTKYAHVTFFFNGGQEKCYEGEDRILIPTPDVATFDLKPEMSAYEVCDAVVERIKTGQYDLIVLNFANCDMVGHTGIMEAAVRAVEAVDECVGRVHEAVKSAGGIMVLTADHGNADKLSDSDGSPFTAHTTSKVPFCVIGFDCSLRQGGRLADIAPTILRIMGVAKPEEMSGESLIV